MPRLTFARAVQVLQLSRQAAGLAMMVAVAKAGLDLGDVGSFEALRYVGYVTTVFWVNGLATAYLRARQTTRTPQRWLTFYLFVAALGALGTFAIFALALPSVTSVLLDLPGVAFGPTFGVYLLGVLLGNVVEQEAIADRAGGRLAAYALSSYGLQTAAFVGPILLGAPLYVAMLGLATSALYRLGWVAARYRRVTDVAPPPAAEIRAFVRSAGNLSAYAVGAAAVIVIDHALVAYGAPGDPAAAVALWRYGAQELPLLVAIVGGLNATALAEMQADRALALGNLRRRGTRVALAFFALATALIATSRWWFPLAFSEALGPGHVLFNTLLLLVPSRVVPTTPQLVTLDLEGTMALTGFVENLLNVAVSLLLLPSLGLLGIAVGTVVAFSFERAAYVVRLGRAGVPAGAYVEGRLWLAGTIALLVAYASFTDFSLLLGAD